MKRCDVLFLIFATIYSLFATKVYAQWLDSDLSFNIDSAYSHLQEQMDKYHKTFDVYTDMDAGGNHYIPNQWMNPQALSLNQACTSRVYSGITCIKLTYFNNPLGWAGVGWIDSVGYNLTTAETCSFWAKGENGGEIIEFGIGGDIGDSAHRWIMVNLTNSWVKYYINLVGSNLIRIKRGFYWVASNANNPSGCTFYLDDIKYDLDRSDSMRFIHSYIPISYKHDQTWALNQAYTYPNVLAMIAFLNRGTPDDRRRARIIGDAFQFCQEHDRFFTDGRLRNAYRSGDIKDHLTGYALLPGWWDSDSNMWYEDRYQVGTYIGEMAWLMIAWLRYDSITHQNRYRSNAEALGNWTYNNCYDSTGSYPGYKGGFEGSDTSAQRLYWKSTEHNLDVYVAFTWLYQSTGDTIWQVRANRALNFVSSMWDSVSGYFRCGTKEDGSLDTLLVLDAQTWGLLVTRDSVHYGRAIFSAESLCRRETSQYTGFCFSEHGDGLWWEGTGQMTCAYKFMNKIVKADTFLSELRRWQNSAPHSNGKGIVATHPDSSYTGMDRFWGRWYYFARLDIGATVWYIFAENGYNPFWGFIIRDSISPSVPVLIAPANGIYTQDTLPRFWWHKSTDDYSGVDYYQLQYARNSGFAGDVTVDVYDTTYQVLVRLPDSIYYWQVRAIDRANNPSSWSSVWSFEIDTRVPSVPTLISPINGIWLIDTSVIFNWSQVTFDAKSPVQYIIQIDTSRNFTIPLVIDTTSLTQDTINLSERRYYWRARVYDLAGNQGVFSDRDSFGVDNTTPSVPVLVAPANSVILNDSFVRFYWYRSTDNLSGVRNYLINIANNSNFINAFDTTLADTTILRKLRDTTYY